MLRDMYARNQMTEDLIKQRIVEQVDAERFRSITNSTLEGLAKRELNLSAIVGKSAEARERRLVPEVIEELLPSGRARSRALRSASKARGSIPTARRVCRGICGLLASGLSHDSADSAANTSNSSLTKRFSSGRPTAEWVTPGHPLFETVRESLPESVRGELEKGAVFFDVHRSAPARLSVYSAAIRDGLGHVLHRRLFIVQEEFDGTLALRAADAIPRSGPSACWDCRPRIAGVRTATQLEHFLVEQALSPVPGRDRRRSCKGDRNSQEAPGPQPE